MKLATFIGMPISEFWDITPFELNIVAESYSSRKKLDVELQYKMLQKMLTVQAYQISRWVWAKKLDIKAILNNMEPKKKMTDNEMLEKVKVLNMLFGGEVRE